MLASTMPKTHTASWRPFWRTVEEVGVWIASDIDRFRAVLQ